MLVQQISPALSKEIRISEKRKDAIFSAAIHQKTKASSQKRSYNLRSIILVNWQNQYINSELICWSYNLRSTILVNWQNQQINSELICCGCSLFL